MANIAFHVLKQEPLDAVCSASAGEEEEQEEGEEEGDAQHHCCRKPCSLKKSQAAARGSEFCKFQKFPSSAKCPSWGTFGNCEQVSQPS